MSKEKVIEVAKKLPANILARNCNVHLRIGLTFTGSTKGDILETLISGEAYGKKISEESYASLLIDIEKEFEKIQKSKEVVYPYKVGDKIYIPGFFSCCVSTDTITSIKDGYVNTNFNGRVKANQFNLSEISAWEELVKICENRLRNTKESLEQAQKGE